MHGALRYRYFGERRERAREERAQRESERARRGERERREIDRERKRERERESGERERACHYMRIGPKILCEKSSSEEKSSTVPKIIDVE